MPLNKETKQRRNRCFRFPSMAQKELSNRLLYLKPFIGVQTSSSSCHATSTDIPDPLSLLLIVHPFWQVLRATSRILTELLYVGSSWSPCFCSAMWEVHRRTSLMSTSLLLQQYPACQVRLTLIASVIGGRWPYSCCFVWCCLQDLFKIAHTILV